MNESSLTRLLPDERTQVNANANSACRLARMVLAILLTAALSAAGAAEYRADRIGDWDADAADDTTLAGALQAASAGQTIALDGDLGGAWDNWPAAGGGFVLLKPGATLTSGQSVTIDLSGHSLSGAALTVGSGAGNIVFANGSLGDAGDDFRVGGGESGRVTLSNVDLDAAGLIVNGVTASTLAATNGSTLAVSSVTLSLVNGSLSLADSSLVSGGAVTVSSGATFSASGTANIAIGGNLDIRGVAAWEIEANPGNYGYRQTSFSGAGALDFTGSAITVSGGADVDLGGFTLTGVNDIGAGETLTVKDVWAHSEGGVSFQSTLTLSGALNVAGAGAVVNIAGGGLLQGLSGISVETGGSVTVDGAVNDADSGKLYRSQIAGGGGLAIAGGTVEITDGGLISGIVDGISITGGGALRIDGVNAAANYYSEVQSTGDLTIGSSGTGSLEITAGGKLVSADGLFGQGGAATVVLEGVGTGNNRAALSLSGDLVADDSTVTIKKGALLAVAGDAVLGEDEDSTTSWTLGGRGGTGGGYAASLVVGGTLTVGDEGTADITINHGGTVQSGGATILGNQSTARAAILIEDNDGTSGHYAWIAGGSAVLPDEYVAPSGNASLIVKDGTMQITGLFAMAGQDDTYTDGFGVAAFGGTGTAELHMSGGSFYNRDASGEIGRIEFNAGSVVSGSGNIYAGDVFVVDGGTIAAGTRWMYHFDKNDNDRLTSLGTLHIHDNAGEDTLFHDTKFRTELDRGELAGNADGLSDRVVVHGDLELDEDFVIDISRPLDGKYLLVQTVDGGSISGFTARGLSDPLTGNLVLNLNGKMLKGNDRIDYTVPIPDTDPVEYTSGGMFTTIEDGDKIYLTVDTTSDGNVKTYWTGDAAGTVWDMTARNFDATLTGHDPFSGDDQFLDGDIVIFDFSVVTETSKRTVNVTLDDINYSGDMSSVGNVRVAEVSVLGGLAADTLVWQGGSIFAYDSALYTTLDQASGNESPSGRMIKIGSGTLEIRNANEFYGGVHLGDPDAVGDYTGGLIVLKNDKGFGTYNSLSGYQDRGVVYVHQDTTIDVKAVGSITNRFIVSPGKLLTFLIDGQFSISGNNALAGDSVNQGKGGGIYIGNEGQVVYQGEGGLRLTDNLAHQGGGIYTELGYTLQVPAFITGNYASRQGGGIFAEKFFQLQDGSTISNNRAQSAGGGIFVGNLDTFEDGDDRKFHIHGDTTVMDNLSGGATGGGIYVDAGRELVISTARETTFEGGDVWFEGNYAMIGFDADNPTSLDLDMTNAYRNALHLSNKSTVAESPAAKAATLDITGPYNTYFYDAISGDVGTKVTIEGVLAENGVNTSHILSATQRGTVVFHADSAFYGDTVVKNGATFRLETYGGDAAIYGRRSSLHPDAKENPGSARDNEFSIDALSAITGRGTIAADNIKLDGVVDLDTGLFSRPDGRDGSGALGAGDLKTQGVLNLDGTVTLADTATWLLNLGTGNTTDRIAVTGEAEFQGATAGQKLALDIDSVVRGKYAVMTTTGGVTGFNTDKSKSDAVVTLNGDTLNLAGPATMDPFYSRVHVVAYVENKNLYLDIGARNRHVTNNGAVGGNWGHNSGWSFNGTYDADNVAGSSAWKKNDSGPATSAYLDGDMVTFTGGVYTLTTNVNPVDLFVTGSSAVTIGGAFGIRTYSTGTTASSSDTRGRNDTTIREAGSAEPNDYDIDQYTGKLYKQDGGVLTFANTGGNVFTHGIEIGVAGAGGDGGTIVFNRGNQLGVGDGASMDFINNGTLNAIATTDLATAIRIADTMTATFDVAAAAVTLTQSGVVSNMPLGTGSGSIVKIGDGTLKVTGANTFAGGTEFLAGTLELGNATAFGTYSTSASDAGVIFVKNATEKIFAVNETYSAVKNRFVVDSLAGNQLAMTIDGGKTLTITGVDAGASNGGVISVGSLADQATFTSTGVGNGTLTITGSTALSGGAIHTEVASTLTFGVVANLNTNTATGGVGGALYAADGVTFAMAATLSGNTAATSGGAIHAGGDVLFSTTATLNTNTATNAAGGAIFTLGDARFSAAASFTSNTAANATGGAIHAGGDVVFTGNATLRNNEAANAGGGVHAAAGSVSFNGATNNITGNKATSAVASTAKGGAVYAQNISVSGNATITGNTSTYRGGAFYVEGGTLTLTPANANNTISFSGNTAAAGDNGEAVYLANGADLAINGAGNVVFDNTIATETAASTFVKDGTGTVLFTGGKQSVFSGNTTVNAGEFRIASGSSYLNAGAANTFTLAEVPVAGQKSNGAFLTGGGTVEAGEFELYGVVAPDSDISTSVPAAIGDDHRIGSLTLDGHVTAYGNGEANSYQFDFDLQQKENATPLTQGDSDVLVVTGGDFTVDPGQKVIFNLHNFGKGKFLLIDVRDGDLVTAGFTGVDGINSATGAFDILIHDFVKTDRHQVKFMLGSDTLSDDDVDERVSDALNAANQLWLATQYNNLYMYWTGAENAIWDGANNETNGNWLDKVDGETHFENRDTVVFTDSPLGGANPAERTIDVHEDGVVVTDMLVNTFTSYTFTGTGGIATTDEYAGDILDSRYGASGSVNVPQELTKTGTGTLEFRNTGGNAFAGGIVIGGGTVAFNQGNQLGDGGKGITFTGSAALEFRADGADSITLVNNIILANTITATVGVVDGKTLTLSGIIDAAETTANLTKTGGGTLVLSNADNAWTGTTTVSGGTLRAEGVAALGRNTSANEIAVAALAELEIGVGADTEEALNKQVTGAGKLEKTGAGTLVLNHTANSYAGGTTITGGKIVAETLNSVGNNVAGGTVTMVSGTTLEMKLDASEEGLFLQRITGAGTLIKSDAGILELSNTNNNYTGGTEITGGGIKISNVGSLGSNALASVVKLNGESTTLEFASAAGTFNHVIEGSGSLAKSGTGTLTLTGPNTFTGGTTLSGGGIVLGNATAAGEYAGSGAGKAGQIDFTGNNTSVASNLAQTIKNRFVVDAGVTGAELAASAKLTIANVEGDATGGAIALAAGATSFTISAGADVTFSGNTKDGVANDVTMGDGSTLILAGAGNIFLGGGIDGSGTVTKDGGGITQIGSDSAFAGTTNIDGGAFRVVDGKAYGTGVPGSAFALDSGATLAGGGTVKAATMTISGTISADTATFFSGSTTIASDSASRFGTLTLESAGGVTLDGFTMDYNVGVAAASSVYTAGLTTGDLLKLTGDGAYELTGGTINFKESLSSGSYLIVHADADIDIGAGPLDGIKGGGVLGATGAVSSHTPRGDLAFVWGGAAHDDHSQIWLDVTRNSLTMSWNQAAGGTFNWDETSGNWQSFQMRDTTSETVYNDGDLVTIGVSNATTLNTSADRLVSGLAVTGAGDLTLGGSGKIEAKTSEAGVIEGQYLLPAAGAEQLIPTGKLVKSGAGTLSFANGDADNGNTFAEGIEISGGAIAFQRANQLGDGGKGIAFKGSAGLTVRDDGDAMIALGNTIAFTDGIVATIDTNDSQVTLSGAIDSSGTTAGLTKTGSGTLILSNAANSWQGATTISGGTLRAEGVSALGQNAAGNQIAVAALAELEIDVDADTEETLNKQVTGAGKLEKTGDDALVLTHAANSYTGGTTITGGRIVAETLGSVGDNVAGGTVDTALGTALELKLDAGEGGMFSQKLTGSGKLEKSGAETLYLANAGNTYSGGTDISGGQIRITDIAAIGAGAIHMGGSGTSLNLDLSVDDELGHTVSGLGRLVKTDAGIVTLSGANTYAGGTELHGGGIILGNATAAGAYATSGGTAGQIDFKGDDTSVASNLEQTIRNRFVVDADVTGAKLATSEKLAITGVEGGASGGAVVVGADSGFTIEAGADLTFSGNKKGAAANDVTMGAGSTLALTGTGNIFLGGGIDGSGTVTKSNTGITQIGSDSAFAGTTNIDAGTFRVVEGARYGADGVGTSFSLAADKTLSGGGTVKAGTITISGIVSADQSTFSSGSTTVAAADKFATLSLEGAVTLKDSFVFEYDAKASNDSVSPTGDLLAVSGGLLTIEQGGTINVRTGGSALSGSYHIIDADRAITLSGGSGIGDLLTTKIDGNAISDYSVRGTFSLTMKAADTEVWLDVDHNSLNMVWDDNPANTIWSANAGGDNWTSKQGGGALEQAKEKKFSNGDYVHFTGAGETITVDGAVEVAGFEFNSSGNYTFIGAGTISAADDLASTVGRFLPGNPGSPTLTPDGKLIKSGDGTLSFANGDADNGNTFAGGIEISGGAIAFQRANQLGDGGSGIMFKGTAGLTVRDDGDAMIALDHNIAFTDGIVATIDTNDKQVTLSGKIDETGTTAGLTKTGSGTLILSNAANNWQGKTTISGGTLRAVGVAALGYNVAAGEIDVADTAELEIDVASGSGTLNREVTGAGALEKTGAGTLVLNNAGNSYEGGTVITGGRIIAETVGSVGDNVAGGTVDTAVGTALELKLDATEGGTFLQKLTGAGKLAKSGEETLYLANAGNTYSGGTDIADGRIRITDIAAIGTGAIHMSGAGASLNLDLATDDELDHTVSGLGRLVKTDAGIVTLSGANTYAGGTELHAGGIILDNAAAAGSHTGVGKAGQIDFTGNDTTVTSNREQSIKNRFVVDAGVTGAKLATSEKLAIAGVEGGATGGAVVLGADSGFTIEAGADLTFSGNKKGAAANDVTMGAGSTLALTGTGDIFLGGGIDGSGTVTKSNTGITQIGSDSEFAGATNIDAGAFRVVEGARYGAGGAGTSFSLAADKTLSGGGTVKADTITISGIVSADESTFSSGSTTVAAADKFATLSLEGAVTLKDSFVFEYDANASNDSVSPTGDLLAVSGGLLTIEQGGTINIRTDGSALSGSYHIIDADQAIALSGGLAIEELLTAKINGNAISGYSVRGTFSLTMKAADTEVWLDVDHNSLNMVWDDNPANTTWSASAGGANWTSKQGGDAPQQAKEREFSNGDYVHFTGLGGQTITVVGAVEVAGFEFDSSGNYTFDGAGTISAAADLASTEGRFLPGNPGSPTLTPDGKLIKSGDGTLSFANGDADNGNTFAGGIEISGGAIAFQRANQLGDGGNGITFKETAVLTVRDDGDAIIALGNTIAFTDGIVATIDTNDSQVTLSGRIDQAGTTAGLTKIGSGTLVVSNAANNWKGATTISGGTLRAVGVAALGQNAAGNQIVVANLAELEIDVDADTEETLNKQVTGAGKLEKTGDDALVLTHAANSYTGGTTITGGRIVAETLGSVGDNVAGGTVDTALGTALELKLDAGEGGMFSQKLTGSGKLEKSGAETLYLANAGNSYSGGTDISGGQIRITDIAAIGAGAIHMGGSGTSLKLDLSADDELGHTVSGLGRLVKTDAGIVTLSGANTYAGGTELHGGGIILGNATAAGAYATSGGTAGQIDFKGDDTSVASNLEQTIRNRFVVDAGVTGASLATTRALTVQNVKGNASGGAIVMGAGSEFAIDAGADLTFSGNAKGLAANDVTMGSGSALALNGAGDIFLGGGIDGSGTVTKSNTGITQIGSNSEFSGTTAIDAGAFRVVQGVRYGAGGDGSSFSLAADKTLSGGGTVKAETITISGIVSADKSTFSSGSTTVDEADKFATLSLEGAVTLKNGFVLEYDARNPNGSVTPTGDLLAVSGGLLTIEQGGTINVRSGGSALSGSYHIIDADQAIALSGGLAIEELLGTKIDGNAISGYSVRGTFSLSMKEAGTEVWLDIDHNSLNMVWDDNPANTTWSTSTGGDNWTSKQGGDAPRQTKEKGFNNGDYVHFTGAGGQTITIDGAIEVAGFEFDSSGDYTFDGAGTIHAAADLASTEGRFLPGNPGLPTLTPDGKLIKSGDGTLSFANGTADAGNTFAGGIEISGGAIAFQRANQLGDGGKGITFKETAVLTVRDDGDAIIALDNTIAFTDGIVATIDTNDSQVTLSGTIDAAGTTAGLTKTGSGTLVVSDAANNWKGATTISGGTLRAEGVEALGDNASDRAVAVGNGAELEIDVAADSETLRKQATGAGALEKTGDGVLVLNHADNSYAGGTVVTGGRIVAETLGSVGGNVAGGTVDTGVGTVLELKLDADEGGAFAQKLTGSGKLEKSGAETLTLGRSDNGYTGGTGIIGGRIAIGDVGAVGANVADGVVAMTGAGTSFEIGLAADGVFNQKITGVGQLVKSAATAVTLTNANSFGGGTLVEGGAIVLGHAEALAKTDGAAGSLAGQVFVNNDATVSDSADVHAVQNRFEVAAGKHLTLDAANGVFAIADNTIVGANGGAVELKAGAGFTTTGSTHLSGNSAGGSGGAIYAPDAAIVVGGHGANTVASVSNNTAGLDGGGVYAKSVSFNAGSGGTTVSGNTATAGKGGAAYLTGGASGANAISILSAVDGDLAFSGNTASGAANAIHMDEYATLKFVGGRNIDMFDSISSTAGSGRGNLIHIAMDGNADAENNAVNLYGASAYYGDTRLEKGIVRLNDGARFGAASPDSAFSQEGDGVLMGVGTIEAKTIALGGLVNAGEFTTAAAADIRTLDFVGAVSMGRLDIGQTRLNVDIDGLTGAADLLDITGTLTLQGETLVDFNTFSLGKYLLAQTSGGVSGHTADGYLDGELKISDFASTVGGATLNPGRFSIDYTLENGGKDIYVSMRISNNYVVWTGANENDPTFSGRWPFVGDDEYEDKWLNDPLYNWQTMKDGVETPVRFRQGDMVAFDSESDAAKNPDNYLEVRENIQIVTHAADDKQASGDSRAQVADMLVTGGGTYRFTGRGISAALDTDNTNFEDAGGQLVVNGGSTVVFANEANNFQRGILLQDGAVAFDNTDQLGTLFENDSYNNGVTASHGITVEGENSYGRLIANADGMELGIAVHIERETSAFVVDTGGIGFGNAAAVGDHTLTLAHAAVDSHTDPAAPGGPTPVNGIYGLGQLVKTGDGTLVLADENSYEGGTVVERGTLAIAHDNRLGKSGSGVLLDGGALRAMDTISTDRAVVVGDANGGVEVDDGKTVSLGGLVAHDPAGSAPGTLFKTGEGTLFLANAHNTFAGDIVVEAGALRVTAAGAFGAADTPRTLTIDAGVLGDGSARVEVELAGQTGHDGREWLEMELKGNGELVKEGAGILALGTDSLDFTGALTIKAGTLEVMGDMRNVTHIVIDDGAVLCGSGVLGSAALGKVSGGGTIKPCGVTGYDPTRPDASPSATTLTFHGDLDFNCDSIYDIVITQCPAGPNDPSGRYEAVSDCLVVTGGLVTIDPGATLNVTIDYWGDTFTAFDFCESSSGPFTIIDASGASVANAGDLFVMNEFELPRGVEIAHGWNDQLYQIWFVGNPTGSFINVADNHNQREVGAVLEEAAVGRDPGLKDLVQILSQKEIDDDILRRAMTELSGDLRANALLHKQPWRHPFGRIAQERDALPGAFGRPEPSADEGWTGARATNWRSWAEVYQRYADVDSDSNALGYTMRRPGVVLGFDRFIGNHALVGLAFNYSNPDIRQSTGKVKIDDYELGLYGNVGIGTAWNLNLYGGLSRQRYDATRRVFIPAGSKYAAVSESFSNKTDGHGVAASAELSWSAWTGERFRFSPVAAVDYEKVTQDGYLETGGLTALRYGKARFEKLMARAGLDLSVAAGERFSLTAGAHYVMQVAGDSYANGSARFAAAETELGAMSIRGVGVGRNYVNLNVGGRGYLNGKKTLSWQVQYNADIYRRTVSHTGNLSLMLEW